MAQYRAGVSASLRERCAIHEAAHCAACLALGIPVIGVSIAPNHPHLRRACYRPPAGVVGVEAMVIMTLAGGAGERLLCGNGGGDGDDLAMAREYLARCGCNLLQQEKQLVRLKDSAARLVRTPWVEQRIRRIAGALLRKGSLSGAEISELC